jgi:hypothetical protein
LEPGVVGLARIPILPATCDGFDLDRDHLLQQVAEAFASVSANDLELLMKIGAG